MMGVFIFLGIIFFMGKCAFLIGGYNLMKKNRQEQYDERSLLKFSGKIMFGMAGSMALCLASIIFQNPIMEFAGLLLVVVVIAFAIIYANTGNRFKK